MVQLNRYLLPNDTGAGEMSRTCPVVFESRTTLPARPRVVHHVRVQRIGNRVAAFSRSTGNQSRSVICPLFPRLAIPAVPLSCCGPYTQ